MASRVWHESGQPRQEVKVVSMEFDIPIGPDTLRSDAAGPRLKRGPAVDASRHLSVTHGFQRRLVQAYLLLYGKCHIRRPFDHRAVIKLCLLVSQKLAVHEPAQGRPVAGIAEIDLLATRGYARYLIELVELCHRAESATTIFGNPALRQTARPGNGAGPFRFTVLVDA